MNIDRRVTLLFSIFINTLNKASIYFVRNLEGVRYRELDLIDKNFSKHNVKGLTAHKSNLKESSFEEAVGGFSFFRPGLIVFSVILTIFVLNSMFTTIQKDPELDLEYFAPFLLAGCYLISSHYIFAATIDMRNLPAKNNVENTEKEKINDNNNIYSKIYAQSYSTMMKSIYISSLILGLRFSLPVIQKQINISYLSNLGLNFVDNNLYLFIFIILSFLFALIFCIKKIVQIIKSGMSWSLLFGGIYIFRTSFIKCELNKSNFRNSSMRNVNFVHSSLTGADFTGADLHGANLSYTDLTMTNFKSANLKGANLTGANWQEATDLEVKGAIYS